MVSNAKIKKLERRETEKVLLLEKISNMRKFNRHFGTVLATSGHSVAKEGHSLDWGLIQVKEDRMGSNKVVPIYITLIQSARCWADKRPIDPNVGRGSGRFYASESR